MANEKIDMGAFVRDIRKKQGLDAPEQENIVVKKEEAPANSEITNQNSKLKKMGRPKKTRKIEGGAPVTVFFDQETKSKLMLAKIAHKIEMKDLITGATLMFLEKYYNDGQISLAGQDELEKALDKFYGSY